MRTQELGRYALTSCVAAALLAGCGGSQPPIGALDAVAQSPTAQRQNRQASASSRSLLYVVTSDQTDMLTYPGYKQVGTISRYQGNATSNPNNGNVLFDGGEAAFEYAHGGTTPIATFAPSESSGEAYVDAAFDPTSNNIAVTVVGGKQPSDSVAVYQSPSGNPATYFDSGVMPYMAHLCYDDQGNLFVNGSNVDGPANTIAELPKGGSTFTNIALNQKLTDLRTMRWDGAYITVASGSAIYRLQFSGSSGTVVGKTALKGFWGRDGGYWIQGDTAIGPHVSPGAHTHNGRYLGFWHYPEGGRAFKTIKTLSKNQKDQIADATVSVDP